MLFVSSVLHALSIALCLVNGATSVPTSGPFQQLNEKEKVQKHGREGNYTAHEADAAPQADVNPSDFRYYTTTSSPYFVKNLPEFPFSLGEFYSGNMPIKAGDTSRQLFFVFQPTIGQPVDELTIWLNGGPGCSSLEGFFQENGLFVWRAGDTAPKINPYSWVNMTNMLWVEQPVGTGFTLGKPTAKSEEDIARDFVGFLGNFMSTFGIQKYKIYVTGESYAGRYVPYISAALLDKKDTNNYNLKGAMVYDGCIGQFDRVQQQVPAFPFVKANSALFNYFSPEFMHQLETKHKLCGYDGFINKFMKFPPIQSQPTLRSSPGCDIFNTIYDEANLQNPCFSVYDVSQVCPAPLDPMEDSYFKLADGSKSNYFNRPDVKAAMHAPAATQWGECSRGVFVGIGGPENEGDLSPDPIQGVLPKVIEATNRVLVANGDYDFVIMTNGTLLSIQNMTWGGAMGFQQTPSSIIDIPEQGNMGVQHYERGLMWGQTYKAGHMGPEVQPAVSWRHLEWLLGKRETL